MTESAVSTWERGLSYPDLATVGPLARALGVTEGELVSASEDQRGRLDAQQARTHRRWRAALLWSLMGVYAAGMVASLVTNLALTALACVAAAIVLVGLSFVPGRRGRVGPVDGDAVAA